ncbi:MAG: DegT/DnrJ/EryC1/StrS family aminotransferase [Kordiimonadaceae bacterium]|nr:DegT/DnrJ/EryC1/StrS family aminotransferase [Kordiimonadaceae bacterium]
MPKNANDFGAVQDAMENWWAENAEPVFDPENPKVRLHHPTFGPEEVMALAGQMLTTRVTMGPKVQALEEGFCSLLGYQNGVSNNSGSSANLLMLAALTTTKTEDYLRPGDEVILPALTWSTSLWPIIQRGLVPVLVDSDPLTMNVRPEAIEQAIGPKTRAVMTVPVYGNACDMGAITAICNQHKLMLIEDCCESMGATYDGKPVGSFGRVGSFSFYFSHHITTLEGGICVTADEDLADMMRIMRSHGWIRDVKNKDRWLSENLGYDERFTFVNEGYNVRLSEPQAAMGLVQLDKLHGFVAARQQNAAYLNKALSQYDSFLKPQKQTENSTHSWFGFPLLVEEAAPFSRDEICSFLNENGVETRPVIAGNLARHPGTNLFNYKTSGTLEGADAVMERGFAVACHQSLTADALEYMTKVFATFFDTVRST